MGMQTLFNPLKIGFSMVALAAMLILVNGCMHLAAVPLAADSGELALPAPQSGRAGPTPPVVMRVAPPKPNTLAVQPILLPTPTADSSATSSQQSVPTT